MRRLFVAIRPYLFLAVVTLAFFWPLWWLAPAPTAEQPNAVWVIPQGAGDATSYLWPNYRYNAAQLRQGNLPLWNPTLYGGAPYLADVQSGFYYPPNWLFALLPDVPYRAVEFFVALHIWLAGIGMFLFARNKLAEQKRFSPGAVEVSALTAAIAFQFSDVFVTHIGNLNMLEALFTLPWVWLCLYHLQKATSWSKAWRVSLALTGLLTLSILAGHTQMFFYVVLGGAAYWLYALIETQARWRFVVCSVCAGVWALGLSAVLLLPVLELIPYTARSALSYAEATAYSLPWQGVAGWISPLLFGRGARDYWANWERVELGFAGLSSLILAGMNWRNTRWRWWLIGLLAGGLFLALGNYNPLYEWVYRYLPGFAIFRANARFVLLCNAALSLLAAQGLAETLSTDKNIRRNWRWLCLSGLGILLIPLWGWASARTLLPPEELAATFSPLYYALLTASLTFLLVLVLFWRRSWTHWLLLVLTAEMLALGAWVEVDRADPNAGYPTTSPALTFLRSQPAPFRVAIMADVWQANAPQVQGLESVRGVFHPLQLAHYDTYYWSIDKNTSPLYSLLNVKFVIAPKTLPMGSAQYVPVFTEDPQVDIYLNTQALPRILFVSQARTYLNTESVFAALHDANFDPAREVLLLDCASALAGCVSTPLPASDTETQSTASLGLEILEYRAESQRLRIQTAEAGYLVLSEVWYPGWQAWLDGQEIPLLRADFSWRAVAIPAGSHELQMRYNPRSWQIGVSISLFSLLAMGGTAYLLARQSMRSSK